MAWLIRRKGAEPVLVKGEVTVGRASYSTIWLDDTAVSRTHCRLTAKKGQLVIRDESSNGTFVNGVRIGRLAHVANGDRIQIGGHTLTVEAAAASSRRAIADAADEASEESRTLVHVLPGDATTAPPASPPRAASPQPVIAPAPAAAARGILSAPEVPIVRMAGSGESPLAAGADGATFRVEVVEDVLPAAPPVRYRDAVRFGDGSALCVVTDVLGAAPLSPETVARWKRAVRAAGANAPGPDAILQVLNAELLADNLKATAACARLDAKEGLLSIACAGTPPPWIIRANRRVVRAQSTASVGLGAMKSAHWAARTWHFERADTLVLASAGWATPLEETLEGNLPAVERLPEWLRGHPKMPPQGCAICLTML
jgi:pSer/pThr/pTyr-binding forkhead associated (FHA) protein